MAKRKPYTENTPVDTAFTPVQLEPESDDKSDAQLTSEMIEESIPQEFKTGDEFQVQDNTIVPELDSSDLASHSKFDKFRK